MATNFNSDQLFSLFARQAEVVKRVKNGGLLIEAALKGTQGILDGPNHSKKVRKLFNPPSWWEDHYHQIANAKSFLAKNGGEAGFTVNDIPQPPENFIPRTPTEVLLLLVPLTSKKRTILSSKESDKRTFDCWCNFIRPPSLYTWRRYVPTSVLNHLRILDGGSSNNQKMRWVGFDPEVYPGLSTEQALERAKIDGITLTSYESLNAASMFPEWVDSWDGKKWHYPNMAQYQVQGKIGWRYSLGLSIIGPDVYELTLTTVDVGIAGAHWARAFPAIRELY